MTSRYIKTDIINFDGRETFGSFNPPAWLENIRNDNLINYEVTSDLDGRPDLISNTLYGTPNYFWVLVYINKPLDPTNWPTTGSIILAPKKEIIRANT